jgi:hypothetical protein
LIATNAQGELDAGAIRGWMSLQEISTAYQIPLGQLYQGTGLAQTVPPETRINRVSAEYMEGFSPELLREFVDQYLATRGAAAKPHGDAAIRVAQAVSSRAPQTPADPEHPKRSTPKREDKAESKRGGKDGAGPHPDGEEPEVKGFMTLNEIVLKTGVPKDFLLEKLGLTDDIPGTEPVRTWMHEKGKSIADLRDAVAAWRAKPKP